jgi:spore germination protein GerM
MNRLPARVGGFVRLALVPMSLVALVAASCGIPVDSSPRSISVDSAGRTPSGSPTQGGDTTAYLYFVKNDHMAPQSRKVSTQDTTAVLRVLVAGPTSADTSSGLITQIPGGTLVRSVRSVGTSTRVALSRQFQNVIGTAQVEAIAQIVFTVTELQPDARIEFLVGGQMLKVTSPTRGDVGHVGECDFVSLLPTDDQLKEAKLSVDSMKHLSTVRKALTLKCPPGPAS